MDRLGNMYVCLYVCTHTHTHTHTFFAYRCKEVAKDALSVDLRRALGERNQCARTRHPEMNAEAEGGKLSSQIKTDKYTAWTYGRTVQVCVCMCTCACTCV